LFDLPIGRLDGWVDIYAGESDWVWRWASMGITVLVIGEGKPVDVLFLHDGRYSRPAINVKERDEVTRMSRSVGGGTRQSSSADELRGTRR